LLTGEVSELVNSVDQVLIWDEAWLFWVAVFAFDNAGALNTVVIASGLIDGASLISDIVGVHVFVSVHWLTAVATLILGFTRNDNLWGDVDIRPSSVSSNLDSI
jgi:hypothetical protein